MRLAWLLLMLCPLLGCNASSDAAAGPAGTTSAEGGSARGKTLRIVRRHHPDPTWMLKDLQGRVDMCMTVLRANGQEGAPRPAMPSAADMAKWVTVDHEELYAGERRASYSTLAMVWPDHSKGCQLMFYKQVTAKTETRCGASYAGSARAGTPGAGPGEGDASPPEFSEEQLEGGAEAAKACRSEAPEKRSTGDLAQGVTRGGQRCYWVGVDGKAGDGPTQPREPGTHACVHPRYFDGSLPVAANDGGALTLRSIRVLAPGEKLGGFHMPEAAAGSTEAEIVEEGQPIPDSRFSREAVRAYVGQPLVVPVRGSSDASK